MTHDDGKVSIGKVLVVEMAGADLAGTASARVCIKGSGTSLWYLSPSISAHPRRVLGATARGRYVGESCVCR